jgi:hypothetical protein
MSIKNVVSLILLLFSCLRGGEAMDAFAQNHKNDKLNFFQDKFGQLPELPKTLIFRGELLFSLEGGHIQGIQLGMQYDRPKVLLSGSSRDVAYIFMGEIKDDHIEIHSIDTLMTDPFRHAGGFQWFRNFVAVGVEDNYHRNRAKVLIYDIHAENPWSKPLITLMREGERERVTAGAVGMAELEGKLILAIANWDAKNVDFYICNSNDFYENKPKFSSLGSFSSAEADFQWLPYQNINLFAEKDKLLMVGLGREAKEQHVADLFSVHFGEPIIANLPFEMDQRMGSGETFPVSKGNEVRLNLEKLGQLQFQTQQGADFKAGAGIIYHEGKVGLIATPYQLDQGEGVNLFRNFEEWDSENLVILPSSTRWVLVDSLSAPEARQAAVATKEYFFAIDNRHVGKYDRQSGSKIESMEGEGTKHLNSGYLYEDRLLLAHSNYPAAIDTSDIRILDPETMEMEVFKDFGRSEGSLTWVLEKEGYWYCLFAYYREENEKTYLAKFDSNWEEVDRWGFPGEVLDKIGHMSISGGVFWESGFLVTSHDDRELHYVKIPENGNTLQYISTFPAPFWGQGIAVDPVTGNLIGIDRPTQQLFIGRLQP